MFRGDAARNAPAAGGAPLLNMRWRVAVDRRSAGGVRLEQYQKMLCGRGTSDPSALHPLAVGDVLLMRTLQNLLAVDFATGKRLWEVPVDEPAELAPGASARERADAAIDAWRRASASGCGAT